MQDWKEKLSKVEELKLQADVAGEIIVSLSKQVEEKSTEAEHIKHEKDRELAGFQGELEAARLQV